MSSPSPSSSSLSSPEITVSTSSPPQSTLHAVTAVIDSLVLDPPDPIESQPADDADGDADVTLPDYAEVKVGGDVDILQLDRQSSQSRMEDHFKVEDSQEAHSDLQEDNEVKGGGTETATSPSSPSSSSSSFFDVRIAVVGNVDAGKSTLIGVLTSGIHDNGRGLARSRVFLHKHEHENGRTSCISQHIMGFNSSNEPVFNSTPASASAAVKTKAWAQVMQQSSHVVTFIDLAGHEKYLKTTIAGLTGCYPDYAMVIINSLAGITKMTKEHLGVVLALNIPLICVVTKIDLVPENVLARTKSQLFKVLKSPAAQKMPLQIKSSKDVNIAVENSSARICPVFFISSVAGIHINLLHEYISKLEPRREEWIAQIASNQVDLTAPSSSTSLPPPTAVEFSIDEIFNVTGVGVVVSGTVQRGKLVPNTVLLIGPYSDGSFKSVYVRTIHCKRVPVDSVEAGDSCAVSLRSAGRKDQITRQLIRRGMALVDPLLNPHPATLFECEVNILHHPTTIKLGYQCVIHSGMIRQAAALINIEKENKDDSSNDKMLRTGDKALCRFRFLLRPEHLHVNTTFIFREGSTKGLGKIVKTHFTKEEMKEAMEQQQNIKLIRSGRVAHSAAQGTQGGATGGKEKEKDDEGETKTKEEDGEQSVEEDKHSKKEKDKEKSKEKEKEKDKEGKTKEKEREKVKKETQK